MTWTQLKKIALITVFVISSSIVFAQNDKEISLFIDPLQFMGVYDSSIDFSVLVRTEKKFDSEVNFNFIIPFDTSSSQHFKTGRRKGKGFEIGIAPRYKLDDFYVKFSTAYTYHHYNSVRLIDQSSLSRVNFDVTQQVWSNYIAIGAIISIGEFSYLDYSLSIGIRLIHIDNTSDIPVKNLSETYRLGKFLEVEEKGWHKLLGIKLSMRIGRIFFKG